MNINIKKAKLNSMGSMDIEYTQTLIDGKGDSVLVHYMRNGGGLVHDDLKKAFENLRLHLVFLCDQVPEHELIEHAYEQPELSKFMATGYSIGGHDDNEGIVITGHKKLPYKRLLSLSTPFTRFKEKTDNTDYFFRYRLRPDLDFLEKEIKEYMVGKRAVGPQQEFQFPD
jgi:hypothetical protein